jgi:hypothetical protein
MNSNIDVSPGLLNRGFTRESDELPVDRTESLDAYVSKEKTASAASSALQRFYYKQNVLASHKHSEQ